MDKRFSLDELLATDERGCSLVVYVPLSWQIKPEYESEVKKKLFAAALRYYGPVANLTIKEWEKLIPAAYRELGIAVFTEEAVTCPQCFSRAVYREKDFDFYNGKEGYLFCLACNDPDASFSQDKGLPLHRTQMV